MGTDRGGTGQNGTFGGRKADVQPGLSLVRYCPADKVLSGYRTLPRSTPAGGSFSARHRQHDAHCQQHRHDGDGAVPEKCLRQDQDHRIGDGVKEPVIFAGEENAVEHREGAIKIQCRRQGDLQKRPAKPAGRTEAQCSPS